MQKWEDWSFVHCESIKNWFQLIYPSLSWLQYCVLLPCVWLRNIIRKCFVTTVLTLPTHVLQPQKFVRIFFNDPKAIFRVFQLFSQEDKYSYKKNTWKSSQITLIWWKLFNIWIKFGKELASEGVEAAYIARTIFTFYNSCVWLLLVAVTLPITSASCEKFFKNEITEKISQKFHDQWKIG